MNVKRYFAGFALVAGLFASGDALADGKQIAGWDCVGLWGDHRQTFPFSTGGLSNPQSTELSVGCPLMEDALDITHLVTYVVDRNSTDGVRCYPAELDVYGGGAWGPAKATGDDFTGSWEFHWDNDDIPTPFNEISVVRCELPAKQGGGQSAVRSIHWNEEDPPCYLGICFED